MKTIVARPLALGTFFAALALALSAPQQRHLERFCDLLVVAPRRKTLAELAAQECDGVDPSNLADFLRISPWDPEDVRLPLAHFLLRYLRERAPRGAPIYLTLDDSLCPKDRGTHCLEAVDWHYDHNRRRMVRASNHVVLRIHWGGLHFPLSWRLYLRRETVRKRNRRRRGKTKLRYYSKLELAQQLLGQVASLLPAGVPVYVLFDSWYTSAELVGGIRRRGWHVIAGLKSNRNLSGKKLTAWHHGLKGRPYERIRLGLANGRVQAYRVRTVEGRLKGAAGKVRVVISQRAKGQSAPVYFLCTDTSLSAQGILSAYQHRWSQEVDFWHVKLQLGLGDYRVRSYEATERWYAVVYLVLTYLYWRRSEEERRERRTTGLSEVMARIREEHQRQMLREAGLEVSRGAPVERVLDRYLGEEGAAA